MRTDRAIEDLDAAIKIDRDYAAAFDNRGHVRLQQGEYKDALKDFDRAIKLQPDNAIAHFNRGLASYHLGDYERAVEAFSRSIELMPDEAEAYNTPGTRLPEARPAGPGAAGLCDGAADQVVRPGPALKPPAGCAAA